MSRCGSEYCWFGSSCSGRTERRNRQLADGDTLHSFTIEHVLGHDFQDGVRLHWIQSGRWAPTCFDHESGDAQHNWGFTKNECTLRKTPPLEFTHCVYCDQHIAYSVGVYLYRADCGHAMHSACAGARFLVARNTMATCPKCA
jgi:hypothetical protein